MTLKRDLVKYVRDKAKSAYKKESACYICGSTEDLDFHHYYGLTELLEKWIADNKLEINDEESILSLRESFINEYKEQIYTKTVTLCHKHHLELHRLYGRNPALVTAKKQMRWVEIQRDKHGMV